MSIVDKRSSCSTLRSLGRVAGACALSSLAGACGGSNAQSSGPSGDAGADGRVLRPDSGIKPPADARPDGRRDAADSATDTGDAGETEAAPPPSYGDWTSPTAWSTTAWPTPTDIGGAVYDGRYVYFGQVGNGAPTGAAVFRYDTTAPFSASASWQLVRIDPTSLFELGPAAYASGEVFFGAQDAIGGGTSDTWHTRVSVYPATATFTSTSWQSVVLAQGVSPPTSASVVTAAGSDGAAAYFAVSDESTAPTISLVRLGGSKVPPLDVSTKVTSPVTGSALPIEGMAFDGSYEYFVAGGYGGVGFRVKASSFTLASVEEFDVSTLLADDPHSVAFLRAAYDGRFVYFVPDGYGSSLLARYDTTGGLSAASSWSQLDVTTVVPGYGGTNAVAFDGRYLYLAYGTGTGTAELARFDTSAPLATASSWSVVPGAVLSGASKTPPGALTAAAFDGAYVYFAGPAGVWRLEARSKAALPSFLPGGTLN